MNFGNPEKPEIMGEFVGAIEGMREACLALDYPVVSGNVSLYNETSGSAILPTPVIGGVGLIADARNGGRSRAEARRRCADPDRRDARAISAPRSICARSRAARPARRRRSISPPSAATAISCARMIAAGHVAACHDLSRWRASRRGRRDGDGRRPRRRARSRSRRHAAHAWLFGEDQARYLIETADPDGDLGRGGECGYIARNASARSAGPR